MRKASLALTETSPYYIYGKKQNKSKIGKNPFLKD